MSVTRNYPDSQNTQHGAFVKALVFNHGKDETPWAAILDNQAFLSVSIGRADDCDVPIPLEAENGKSVSRRHARIYKIHGDYWVEDLGSRNLTFVNDRLVLAPVQVEIPCSVRLGDFELTLMHDSLDASSYERLLPGCQVVIDTATADVASQEAVHREAGQVLREELRNAKLFEVLVDSFSTCNRAEVAEVILKETLSLYFGSPGIAIHMDCRPDSIGSWLASFDFTPCGTGQAEVSALVVQASATGEAIHVQGRPESSGLWLVPFVEEAGTCAAVLVPSADTERADEAVTKVGSTLRRLLCFAHKHLELLRLSEEQHAQCPISVQVGPSEAMVTQCAQAGFWGVSTAFKRLIFEAERIAEGYLRETSGKVSVVCLLGESGVGKSHLARLIHRVSMHRQGPFIEENSANIQESIAESALFGHTRGAYTGAEQAHMGFFEAAENGTLFLDEIGNMNTNVQNQLLTVMDTGHFRRMGENEARYANCFIVLATNREPEELCEEGRLKRDLWNRIQNAIITIPPLRERLEDIPVLCSQKLRQLNEQFDPPAPKRLAAKVMDAMASYDWPGNVRELLGGLEAAYRLGHAANPTIALADFSERLSRAMGQSMPRETADLSDGPKIDIAATLVENVGRVEREYMVRLLVECGGVRTRMAERAHVSRQTIYSMLEALREWLNSTGRESCSGEVTHLKHLSGPFWRSLIE